MAKIVTSDYAIDFVLPPSEEMNDNDFFSFCLQNKHLKIERDENHQILFMPPEGVGSSEMSINIAADIIFWNRKKSTGKVFGSSAGFYLPDTSMRSPDVAWMSIEKWSKLNNDEKQKFPYTAPEFIIEMMSPSDNQKAAKTKMLKWIQNGVLLGWLIDPQKQETYIYRADNTVTKVQGFTGKLSGENVLAGFEFDLSSLG